MALLKQTIFTGFMPNMTKKDIRAAFSFLCLPWKWKMFQQGPSTKMVEEKMQKLLNIQYVHTIDSGRSALYYALKTLGIGEEDEVLVQAYTCLVVINAIRWTGAKPVYVDVGADFNMNPKDLEKKVTDKCKAVIIQHTFGTPAEIDRLLKLAKKHKLKTIEDCAHSLNVSYNGQKTGTFADISMFSFGGEKVVSCVRGGAIATNNTKLNKKIKNQLRKLPQTSRVNITQHLLKYPIFALAKPLYNLGFGKILLKMTNAWHMTSRIISSAEKYGKKEIHYPSKFPNALATILLDQLDRIEDIQEQRNYLARYYKKEIINTNISHPKENTHTRYLRYTVRTNKKYNLLKKAKKKGIILGKWYSTVVDPSPRDKDVALYKKGSCPNAEKYAKESINLPIHPGMNTKKAGYVAKIVNKM